MPTPSGFCREHFAERIRDCTAARNAEWQPFVTVRDRRWHLRQDRALGAAPTRRTSRSGWMSARTWKTPRRLPSLLGAHASVEEALKAYDAARRPKAESLQRASSASQSWFEQVDRHIEHAVRAVRLLAAHLQHAHHLRTIEKAAPELVRSVDALIAPQGTAAATAAAADVRADQAARPHHPQPRRGIADVHVFGDERHRERFPSGASRQPRRRRRRPCHHRDDRRAAGRPHQPALRRHVCTEHVDAWRRVVDFIHGQSLQGRDPARACRPQGLADAHLGGPPEPRRRPTGNCSRRRRFRSWKAGRPRAPWTAPTWTSCATPLCAPPNVGGRRLRHDRAAFRTRLPDLVASSRRLQQAHRRIRRLARKPHAVSAGGVQRRARRLAAGQTDLHAHLGARLGRGRHHHRRRDRNRAHAARGRQRHPRGLVRRRVERAARRPTAAPIRRCSPTASATR